MGRLEAVAVGAKDPEILKTIIGPIAVDVVQLQR
jgi:hypothetical protein